MLMKINNTEETEMNSIFTPLLNSRKRNVIRKWEKITNKDVIFISFVSDPPGSDFYSSRIQNLVNMLENLGYDYLVTHFGNDRNYYQNCCYKPVYIEEKMKEFNKDIVWIDGDTILKGCMGEFINTDKQFDIGLVTYNNDMTGFVASPVFFRNTKTTNELIENWALYCTEKIESGICELDHDAIKHVIFPRFKDKIKIRLSWDQTNSLHNGMILTNVNSQVPLKIQVLRKISEINSTRPCLLTKKDYIIV